MSANPVLERPRLERGEWSAQERTGDLYERYYDRVFGYCLYKLGDRQEAEDATQTTFLWVMRGLEHGIEPRLEANWLFTIAQNACRARIKTRGRKRERETLSDPHVIEQVAPGRPGVQDELLGLEDALRDMPELQRQAIILREWRGFSYKEIAAELDLTDAAVETLIFRARRSLASRLENPNARSAKRAAFGVNFGWLLSGAKSFFAFGGAANLGALAAIAAAVAIGVGVQGDTPARASAQGQPPAAHARMPVAYASTPGAHVSVPSNHAHSVNAQKKKPTARQHTKRHHASTRPPDHSAPLPGDASEPPADLPVADGLVKTSTQVLAPVADTVDQTLADVQDVVADVGETVEPVVPDLPPLLP